MSTTAVRALARGAWTERYNRGWRFSKAKSGVWSILTQIALAVLLLWRVEPSPLAVPLMLPVAAVIFQGLVGSFMGGLLRGREELYGKSVLRVLHLSPASGFSILGGMTLAGLPQRAVGSLTVAAAIGLLLPAGALWWTVPLLWLLALGTGLVGYAAALLALVGWVRVAPRSLAVMWGVSLALTAGLVYYLLYLVVKGGSMESVTGGLQAAAPWLMGTVGAFIGLPGLVMGTWLAAWPGRAGEWYREAYLGLQELGEGRRQTRASRWPRVLKGPAGALLARQWREIWLNWFTWARLGALAFILSSLGWFRDSLTPVAERSPALVVLGFSLGAVIFAFGELAGAIGGSDGSNIGVGLVAGVRAGQVVKAKWIASAPMALLSAAGAWAVGLLVGQPHLTLILVAGCIGLGFGVIVLGGGLCDLDPHGQVDEREVPDTLRAMLDQVPMKPGGLIGSGAAILFAVVAVWLCQLMPQAALPVAGGLCVVAHLGLVPGIIHLRRLGM